jgi:hypothetical protein
MARIMPMPPDSELPDGPYRDVAGELRRCCRAAGCPTVRPVIRAIQSREDLRASRPGADLPGGLTLSPGLTAPGEWQAPCALPGLPLPNDVHAIAGRACATPPRQREQVII